MVFTEEFQGAKLSPVRVRWERGKNGHASRLVTVSFQVSDIPYEVLQRLADTAMRREEVAITVRFPQAALEMPGKEQAALPLGALQTVEEGVGVVLPQDKLQDNPPVPSVSGPDSQRPDIGVDISTGSTSALAGGDAVMDPAEISVRLIAQAVVDAGKDTVLLADAFSRVAALARDYPEVDIRRRVAVQLAVLRPGPEADDAILRGPGEVHLGMVEVGGSTGRRTYISPTWGVQFRGGKTSRVTWVASSGKRVGSNITLDAQQRLEVAMGIVSEAADLAGCLLQPCQEHPQPHRHRWKDETCLWDPDRAWRRQEVVAHD